MCSSVMGQRVQECITGRVVRLTRIAEDETTDENMTKKSS